jgi:hypothetical protein
METTRVEVISAHYYERDRQSGERYDCANQYLPVLLGRGLVRVVDQQGDTSEFVVESITPSQSVSEPFSIEVVLKRKRGRPFGSGMGHYKKRSVVSETSVDR